MRPLRAILLLAVLTAAAVAIGCGEKDEPPVVSPLPEPPGGVICTEIGCSSGLSLDLSAVPRELPRADRIRVCVDDRCAGHPASIGFVELRNPRIREGQTVKVALEVFDRRSRTLHQTRIEVVVIKAQPNGPRCPPTCFQVPVQLDRNLRLIGVAAIPEAAPDEGAQPSG